jgi:RND family efflux transporter MFP subunit
MRLLIFALLFTFFSCAKKSGDLIHPEVRDITESVYASGFTWSKDQYEVFSKVNGIVERKFVTEGDTVQAGQVLMTLMHETPKLNTENARLALDYAAVSSNQEKLRQAEANINFAREKLQNDSTLYQRQNKLWEEGIGSRNELEQKELSWKNALSNYQLALLQLNELRKQINFSAKQSTKNYEVSSSLASDYSIRAIQRGRIYQILKEPGEMVSTTAPVAVLGNAGSFIIKLQVDEYDISKIKTGQKLYVSMDAFRGQTFEAVVSKIQPIMDEKARSFEIEASFISAPENLYPNLTVEANILIRSKKNALTIPRSCLVGDSAVLLSNGRMKKVVTGMKDYQTVEIIEGLSKNDLIKSP